MMDGLFCRASHYVNFPINDISQTERAVVSTGFPRVLGANDCTHIAIRGLAHWAGLFINLKGYHSIKAQLDWTTGRGFCRYVPNFPGSCHDSFILRESNIPALFHAQDRLKGWLLGDMGYPLQTWLMTPLRNPTSEAQQRYNDSYITTWSVIEQAIRMLKMRFRCLDRSEGALQYSPARVCRIIIMCCVRHNITQRRGLLVDDLPCAHEAAAPAIDIEEDEEEEEEEGDDGQTIRRATAHLGARGARESLIFDRFS
ncbi:putative nuclease HARBI1 [Heptranchias perlo]|uniref:putative nuclease HARBI1 n=1 Tax=Heptranchias perlo TaxID=212740 RepID=UPI00355999E4